MHLGKDRMELTFHWIGWCTEGTSDKVWGYCGVADSPQVYVFWARRGKRLRFKNDREINAWNTQHQKRAKQYRQVNEQQLKQHWPNFEDDLSSDLCLSILSDKVL